MRTPLALTAASTLGRASFVAVLVLAVLAIAVLVGGEALGQTGQGRRMRLALDCAAVAVALLLGGLVLFRFVVVR